MGDAKMESDGTAEKVERKVPNAVGGLKDALKGKQAPWAGAARVTFPGPGSFHNS